MHKWHPVYPAHVSVFECFPSSSNPGHKLKVTKQMVQPLDDMGRSIFELAVSRSNLVCDYSDKYPYILVCDYSDD